MSIEFDTSILRGKAGKRMLDDSPVPPYMVGIEKGIPAWVREQIPNFWEKYKIWMSMSTVAFPIQEIEGYNSKTLTNTLKAGQYNAGYFSTPFCCDATQVPKKPAPKPNGRGRRPIQTPKPESRRAYGTVASFGTCLQCSCAVPFETKKGPTNEYRIKLFSNNIQIPGCLTEDFRDAKMVLALMAEVLQKTIGDIPRPPPMLFDVVNLLHERGLGALNFMEPSDFELRARSIQDDNFVVYSRNYNVHYLPLTLTEDSLDAKILDPQELFSSIRNNPDMIREWCEEVGLHTMIPAYESDSENTNRRIQLIFYAPKTIPDPKNIHITKIFIESSGKIAINLANNYYWMDILWRFICFLDKLFDIATFYSKKTLKNQNMTEPSDAQIDAFLARITDAFTA